MSERLTLHAWGFYDYDGKPKLPDGIAVSAETPSPTTAVITGRN